MSSVSKTPNHLSKEKSPYLLQHAFNPVDWYPWGEEAFEKAEKEDKPIFLSIGYSTCHWCHVMERESFEDTDVAKILNENFVAIKVDREERPDIDNVYMNLCILIRGTGGWPLTMITTPKKQPFFAGTYFPKKSRRGMTGLIDILKQVVELWKTDKIKLISSAEKTVEYLKENVSAKQEGEALDQTALEEGFVNLLESFDSVDGGFGARPKFPIPFNLLFLLRYWKKKGTSQALSMVEKTLQKMRQGGIFDQVGYGFHRYSTDSTWLVPHFEKMLYDQALICMAYTEAYLATGKPEFRRVVEETLEYVSRSMSDSEGGFYSAEDADSEGKEGRLYLWTEAEIREALGADADSIIKVFNITKEGNYDDEAQQRRTGRNILHLTKAYQELANEFGISMIEFESFLERSRRRLFEAREKKIPPLKDTKILTDWNGLMAAALAKCSTAFNQPIYAEKAEKTLNFILERLQTVDGKLCHRYKDGETAIRASIEDYAFTIWGLIEVYEATFKVKFLAEALRLQREAIKHFWDNIAGGFYFTAEYDEKVLVRVKEYRDSAIPSANAVSLLNLTRLARMTGEVEFEEKAQELQKAIATATSVSACQNTMLLAALDFAIGPTSEVVIVGDKEDRTTKEALRVFSTKFIPNMTILLKGEEDEQLVAIAEHTKVMRMINDKTTIYVCRNYTCNQPTNDIAQALEAVNK
ncbi:MAG: uncharacterized protein QG670_794 [Thermoproteota archaeon]|nr:uncharacterized protein [Thermoproteota archaeon]